MAGRNKETIGVVLLNLGGPDSLSAVKPFLYNLLSDREIIRLGPSFMQKPIAWLISRLRSRKTEKMYSLIGGKSPILDITMTQAEALEKALNAEVKKIRSWEDKNLSTSQPLNFSASGLSNSELSFRVYVGMRYWRPFIRDTVQIILKDGIKQIIVLSLYPHHSKATTGSAISEFKRVITEVHTPTHPSPFKGKVEATLREVEATLRGDPLRDSLRGKGGGAMEVQYIEHWYDFPPYIDALTELIAKGMSEFNGENVDIIYSAHSLPQSLIDEGDPYLEQIKGTITAVNSLLATRYSLPCRWHLSFQSKSGPVKWLQPATDKTIIKLAKTGVKNLFVVPISFVSDHVETRYEIDVFYKGLAKRYGINLRRCQSLNTSEKFITALKELVMRETQMIADEKKFPLPLGRGSNNR